MQSRTLREGSVGLLILAGLVLLGGLVFWIRGLNPGRRSYQIIATFDNVAGMRSGAPVRYRGVVVGKIQRVQTGSNAAEAIIEINSSALIIPNDVTLEANQIGLIGETSIDIFPNTMLPESVLSAANPLADDCNSQLILCDGDRLSGNVGVSYDTLIRSTVEIADLLTETGFFDELRELTRNTADAASGVADLSREFTGLTRTLEQELTVLSAAAVDTTNAVGQVATELNLTTQQVNELISANRTNLIATLDNINQTSTQLRTVVDRLAPAINEGELVNNLTALSENAAIASENLRNFSDTFGSPENLVMIQQTLDAARATFQNAQKLTSDVDELIGDPEFRQNLRNLVDGLSGLVSSTQDLQQQTQLAYALESDRPVQSIPNRASPRPATEAPYRAPSVDSESTDAEPEGRNEAGE
jgi:phospholipid/cholesterol/gamma-HCH transport system substrate-binding protein